MSNQTICKFDKLFFFLFVMLCAFQIWALYFTPLDLAPDEAHYWEWSRRLDYSYYSKGPAVAYLIALSRIVFGDTAQAVRMPAVLCSNLMLLILYFFVRSAYSPRMAFAAFLCIRTMLIFASQGYAMTTDPLAALCWLVALICAHRAVVGDNSKWWIASCFAIGIGMLSKYTVGIEFLGFGALLLFTQSLWRHLKSFYTWLAVLVLFACLIPILLWNMQHDWVNLAHNAGHITPKSGIVMGLQYLVELIFSQMGLVGPVFFVWFLYALWFSIKGWRKGDSVLGLYASSVVFLAGLCVVVSTTRRIYPNWPMPMYLGGVLMIIHLIHHRCADNKYFADDSTVKKYFLWNLGINSFFTIVAYAIVLGLPVFIPGEYLPTKKLIGWKELGARIENILTINRIKTGNHLPVLATDYGTASEIAFYAESHPEVFCAYVSKRRMNQYDVWGGWNKLAGKDMLVVVKNNESKDVIQTWFKSLELVSDGQANYSVTYEGTKLRDFEIYIGRKYLGGEPVMPNNL